MGVNWVSGSGIGSALGIVVVGGLAIHYWPVLLVCIGVAILISHRPHRKAAYVATPVRPGQGHYSPASYPQAHYSNRR